MHKIIKFRRFGVKEQRRSEKKASEKVPSYLYGTTSLPTTSETKACNITRDYTYLLCGGVQPIPRHSSSSKL